MSISSLILYEEISMFVAVANICGIKCTETTLVYSFSEKKLTLSFVPKAQFQEYLFHLIGIYLLATTDLILLS